MKTLAKLLMVLGLVAMPLTFTACESEEDTAAEDIKDGAEDLKEDIKDATD